MKRRKRRRCWSRRILTHGFKIVLLIGTRGTHGVGFAGTGLTIGQDGDIVPLEERADAVREILPDTLLLDRLGKDAIKNEQLATLGDIDGDTGRGRDMDHGALETLRD